MQMKIQIKYKYKCKRKYKYKYKYRILWPCETSSPPAPRYLGDHQQDPRNKWCWYYWQFKTIKKQMVLILWSRWQLKTIKISAVPSQLQNPASAQQSNKILLLTSIPKKKYLYFNVLWQFMTKWQTSAVVLAFDFKRYSTLFCFS